MPTAKSLSSTFLRAASHTRALVISMFRASGQRMSRAWKLNPGPDPLMRFAGCACERCNSYK